MLKFFQQWRINRLRIEQAELAAYLKAWGCQAWLKADKYGRLAKVTEILRQYGVEVKNG